MTPERQAKRTTQRRALRHADPQKAAEESREQGRRWRAENPERYREIQNRWKKNNPRKVKANHVRRLYGISLEEYEAVLAGACALCERPAYAIDHCHDTGRIRGGLCNAHNVALGQFGDDPERLEAAARYLREADALAEKGQSR